MDDGATRGFSALVKKVILDAYMAAGIADDCSYLLCNVSSGQREILFMRETLDPTEGLRTRERLAALRSSDGSTRDRYFERVLQPNAVDASRFAFTARRTLASRGLASVVLDPTCVDVGGAALQCGVDVQFDRSDYLEINGRILREFARRIFVCPGSEYGSGLKSDLSNATERSVPLVDLDGNDLGPDDVQELAKHARAWMHDQGFSDLEIDDYLGPSALSERH